MIKDTPDSIKGLVGLSSYNYITPSTYIPIITQDDYDYGYITRFFVARINYVDIFETNNKDYNLANCSYFNKTKIDWKITGTEFNVYNGKMLETTGVVNYNTLRIRDASAYIPNIDLILNNPKQFWRGY